MCADSNTTTSPQDQLVAALEAVLDELGPPQQVQPGVYAGDNLPDRLSAALTLVAQRRGREALTAHRPGCWEAEHVQALVMLW